MPTPWTSWQQSTVPARTRLQLAGWPVNIAQSPVSGLQAPSRAVSSGGLQGGRDLGEVGVGLVRAAGAGIAEAGDLAVALQLGADPAIVDHHFLAAVVGVLEERAVALCILGAGDTAAGLQLALRPLAQAAAGVLDRRRLDPGWAGPGDVRTAGEAADRCFGRIERWRRNGLPERVACADAAAIVAGAAVLIGRVDGGGLDGAVGRQGGAGSQVEAGLRPPVVGGLDDAQGQLDAGLVLGGAARVTEPDDAHEVVGAAGLPAGW